MSFIIFLVLIIFIMVPVGMQIGLSNKITSEKKAVELIEERKRVLTIALVMFIIESFLCVFIIIDCFGDKEILGFNYCDFGEGVMCIAFAVMFSFISIPGVLYTLIRRVSEPIELQEDLKKFLMEEEKKKCQQMAVEQKFSEDFELLVKKYGNCDKIIKLGDDIEDCVMAFSSSQQLFIKGELVRFDSILNCYLIDNDTTITTTTGRTDSTTQNNTGSTIGRAVVGGVVAGGVGAIVGGATAKKETTSTHRSTSVTKKKHDYVIVLEIRDIAQPIIKISCAENEDASCEILGMVNAIISLNQQ
jgi:hypothetical protein